MTPEQQHVIEVFHGAMLAEQQLDTMQSVINTLRHLPNTDKLVALCTAIVAGDENKPVEAVCSLISVAVLMARAMSDRQRQQVAEHARKEIGFLESSRH